MIQQCQDSRFLCQRLSPISPMQVGQLSHGFAACLPPYLSVSLSLSLSPSPPPLSLSQPVCPSCGMQESGRHPPLSRFSRFNVMQLRHGIIAGEMARVKSKKRTRRREIHVHSVNEAITASAPGARTRIRVSSRLCLITNACMRGMRAYGSRVTNRREILVIPVITSGRASIRRACLLAGGSLTRARYSRDTVPDVRQPSASLDAHLLVQFANVAKAETPETADEFRARALRTHRDRSSIPGHCIPAYDLSNRRHYATTDRRLLTFVFQNLSLADNELRYSFRLEKSSRKNSPLLYTRYLSRFIYRLSSLSLSLSLSRSLSLSLSLARSLARSRGSSSTMLISRSLKV